MNPQPSKLSVIFAGEIFTVTLLDGATATVRVRAMPARHLGRVLQLADKEAELLDFVCSVSLPAEAAGAAGQTPAGQQGGTVFQPVEPGWSDNLTDGSHIQLYEAAKRLNFSRAVAWAERQIAAKQFTAELAFKAEEALLPMMEKVVALLGSLAKPSSSPAAPSTKS